MAGETQVIGENVAKQEDRTYDVVLYGVTGFTGRLVAEYLLQHDDPERPLRWAMAGRNLKKLETIQKELSNISSRAMDVPLIQANSRDQETLNAMAAQTRVVCTTVGPYAHYGSGLVKACVEEGAHYCDLTGETQWIRQMIDAHHEQAVENGVRIVHCCGFDSIPSDLGVWQLQQHAQETLGEACEAVNYYMVRVRGGFSGGTVASLSNVVDEAKKDAQIRKILLDPYALNPKDNRPSLRGQRDQMGVDYAEDLGQWTGPFMMAPINTRIVRRSNALLNHAYGESFKYSETTAFGDGLAGRAKATSFAAGYSALMGGLAFGPTRSLLVGTVLPNPGEGPSREMIETGFFKAKLIGHVKPGGKGDVEVTVTADKDPGYGATAIMLAESARCLALDELDSEGGILTPSVAMGAPLLARLTAAGMRFDARTLA